MCLHQPRDVLRLYPAIDSVGADALECSAAVPVCLGRTVGNLGSRLAASLLPRCFAPRSRRSDHSLIEPDTHAPEATKVALRSVPSKAQSTQNHLCIWSATATEFAE